MTLSELRRALELLPPETGLVLPARELLSVLQADAAATTLAPDSPASTSEHADTWLNAQQVAKALGVSKRYVYAHRSAFPFAKQLPGGAVRFSKRGLHGWMERTR